jgi:hypothetical protein
MWSQRNSGTRKVKMEDAKKKVKIENEMKEGQREWNQEE